MTPRPLWVLLWGINSWALLGHRHNNVVLNLLFYVTSGLNLVPCFNLIIQILSSPSSYYMEDIWAAYMLCAQCFLVPAAGSAVCRSNAISFFRAQARGELNDDISLGSLIFPVTRVPFHKR